MKDEHINIFKYACRVFPPNTKFTSLFGAVDIVSENDDIRIDKYGDCYILCKSGQYRLIYSNSYWANIYKN